MKVSYKKTILTRDRKGVLTVILMTADGKHPFVFRGYDERKSLRTALRSAYFQGMCEGVRKAERAIEKIRIIGLGRKT
jgi:hypothetical protein